MSESRFWGQAQYFTNPAPEGQRQEGQTNLDPSTFLPQLNNLFNIQINLLPILPLPQYVFMPSAYAYLPNSAPILSAEAPPSFETTLDHYAKTGSQVSWEMLRTEISKASHNHDEHLVQYYFNCVFKAVYTKHVDALTIFQVFFSNIRQMHTRSMVINHSQDIFPLAAFITSKAGHLIREYFKHLRKLHEDQHISGTYFKNLVWSTPVIEAIYKLKANDIHVLRFYLDELAYDLESGKLPLNFASIATFLSSLSARFPVGDREQKTLMILLDRACGKPQTQVNQVLHLDSQGFTSLMNVLTLNNTELAKKYFQLLSLAIKGKSISQEMTEMLILTQSSSGNHCLYILAKQGNMQLLQEFVNFLDNHFNSTQVCEILSKLIQSKTYDNAPILYTGSGSQFHPMNIFLSTLSDGQRGPLTALDYLTEYFEVQQPDSSWTGAPLQFFDLAPVLSLQEGRKNEEAKTMKTSKTS